MAENLDLNIKVNTSSAEGSIGSLKKQLREAQNEVVALSEKFGATSAEAVNAAKKAAELRDKIGDAKSLTDAFNPDAKFKALTASLSGVAGGFGAVQGAMALFGNESENVQKTLLKVQSAMAISQGLQSVGESIDSFKQLGAVIKTQVTSAFSTLRGAIISTGIGALVVALGLLVANFDKVKESILNAFPSLGEFGNKISNIVQSITDFVGITSKAARAQEDLKKAMSASVFALDQQIKLLEAQDGKEAEVYGLKKQRINEQLKVLGNANDEEIRKRIELNTELQVLDLEEQKRIKQNGDDAEKLRKDAYKKKEEERIAEYQRADAEHKKIVDVELKIQQDLLKLDEQNAKDKREIAYRKNEDLIASLDYQNELLDFDYEADQQRLANKEAYIAEQKVIELSNLDLTEKERLDIIAKYADQEREIDKEITQSKKDEKEAQMAIQLQYLDFVSQTGVLLGQIAGKNKGVAIAGLLIEKGAAIAKIVTQMMSVPAILPPGIPNPAYVPARIGGALSIASVIAAASQGIQSINSAASGGGGVGGGAPSVSSSAPIIPPVPTAQVTQLNQKSINDIGNQAVRAYVVETDVTSNQQRIEAIRQRARFS